MLSFEIGLWFFLPKSWLFELSRFGWACFPLFPERPGFPPVSFRTNGVAVVSACLVYCTEQAEEKASRCRDTSTFWHCCRPLAEHGWQKPRWTQCFRDTFLFPGKARWWCGLGSAKIPGHAASQQQPEASPFLLKRTVTDGAASLPGMTQSLDDASCG